jgi:Tfp pilus assembly protein PilO
MTPSLPLLAQADVIVQAPPLPPLPPWALLSEPALVLITLAFIAGTVLIAFPLIRAISRRLEGKQRQDPAVLAEIEDLRARVAELEQRQGLVHELEERLDFTERLLAQQREQARLPH